MLRTSGAWQKILCEAARQVAKKPEIAAAQDKSRSVPRGGQKNVNLVGTPLRAPELAYVPVSHPTVRFKCNGKHKQSQGTFFINKISCTRSTRVHNIIETSHKYFER